MKVRELYIPELITLWGQATTEEKKGNRERKYYQKKHSRDGNNEGEE